MGATVVATSRSEAKRDEALTMGASAAFDSADDRWPVEADVVVESVGAATWEQSVRALQAGGRLVVCGGTVGAQGRAQPAPPVLQAVRDHRLHDGQLRGVRRGHRLVDGGLPVQIDQVVPLDDYPDALARLSRASSWARSC